MSEVNDGNTVVQSKLDGRGGRKERHVDLLLEALSGPSTEEKGGDFLEVQGLGGVYLFPRLPLLLFSPLVQALLLSQQSYNILSCPELSISSLQALGQLLLTGKSMSICSVAEVKSAASALGIDMENLVKVDRPIRHEDARSSKELDLKMKKLERASRRRRLVSKAAEEEKDKKKRTWGEEMELMKRLEEERGTAGCEMDEKSRFMQALNLKAKVTFPDMLINPHQEKQLPVATSKPRNLLDKKVNEESTDFHQVIDTLDEVNMDIESENDDKEAAGLEQGGEKDARNVQKENNFSACIVSLTRDEQIDEIVDVEDALDKPVFCEVSNLKEGKTKKLVVKHSLGEVAMIDLNKCDKLKRVLRLISAGKSGPNEAFMTQLYEKKTFTKKGNFKEGDKLKVASDGCFYSCRVVTAKHEEVKVHYMGWSAEFDEWIPYPSFRVKLDK